MILFLFRRRRLAEGKNRVSVMDADSPVGPRVEPFVSPQWDRGQQFESRLPYSPSIPATQFSPQTLTSGQGLSSVTSASMGQVAPGGLVPAVPSSSSKARLVQEEALGRVTTSTVSDSQSSSGPLPSISRSTSYHVTNPGPPSIPADVPTDELLRVLRERIQGDPRQWGDQPPEYRS